MSEKRVYFTLKQAGVLLSDRVLEDAGRFFRRAVG